MGACSQTGMGGGHEGQGPVGKQAHLGLPDSLTWAMPSSKNNKVQQLQFDKKKIYRLV